MRDMLLEFEGLFDGLAQERIDRYTCAKEYEEAKGSRCTVWRSS